MAQRNSTKKPTQAKQIFVNLPVKDLKKAMDFFSRLGFTFNPKFSNKNGACMIIGKDIYAMLLTDKFFKGFTKKKIADAKKTTEVLVALSVESRARVDALVKLAVAAGGLAYLPAQDHGWMYQHGFADLDGHQWEIFFADESKLKKR